MYIILKLAIQHRVFFRELVWMLPHVLLSPPTHTRLHTLPAVQGPRETPPAGDAAAAAPQLCDGGDGGVREGPAQVDRVHTRPQPRLLCRVRPWSCHTHQDYCIYTTYLLFFLNIILIIYFVIF